MELNNFVILNTASFREALSKVDSNHQGIVFISNAQGEIGGLLTDGDIRRRLLAGVTLDDRVEGMENKSFTWAPPNASRESLLKKLDGHIRVIPILDENRRLISVLTRDFLPIQVEKKVYARARAPVRISFGGGGSDLTHYFSNEVGAVINATISLYSHATLKIREDGKITINSRDLRDSFFADNLDDAICKNGKFGLIQSLLKAIHPDFGFDLYLSSDFPMASGLGGSAVVSAAILGCFNQFRRDQWSQHELAELAFQAERLYSGISGGWQDQYASIFGGFNFMEFGIDQNIIHPLRIPLEVLLELEESLVLCYTGIQHNSGDIHEDQRIHMRKHEVLDQVKKNVALTYLMRNQLLRGHLRSFGRSLDTAWRLKKSFSPKISTPQLDSIYSLACSRGALGGKLLGAGGGGFFIFYVEPFCRHDLMAGLDDAGLKFQPFQFESQGLRAWTSRQDDEQF